MDKLNDKADRPKRSVSHYERLGVAMDADKETIKRAYRSKIALYHPDRVGSVTDASDAAASDNTEMVHALNTAYETLKDPAARARYDAALVREWRGQTLSVIRERVIRAAHSSLAHARVQADALLAQAKEKLIHLPTARVLADSLSEKVGAKLDDKFGDGFSDAIGDKLGAAASEVRQKLRNATAKSAKAMDVDATCEISLNAAYYGGVVQVNHAERQYQLTLPKGVTHGDVFTVALGDNPKPVRLGIHIHEAHTKCDGRDVHYQVTLSAADADKGTQISLPPPLTLTLTLPPHHRYPASIVISGRGIPVREGKEGKAGDLYVDFRVG